MSHLKVIWNNSASMHLAEVLNLQYVDETYKELSEALQYLQRVQDAAKDKEMSKARFKIADMKRFAAILLASHKAYCEANKLPEEWDKEKCLDLIRAGDGMSLVVEVLAMAVKTFLKSEDSEKTGEVSA